MAGVHDEGERRYLEPLVLSGLDLEDERHADGRRPERPQEIEFGAGLVVRTGYGRVDSYR
jgi:hypothetical protein